MRGFLIYRDVCAKGEHDERKEGVYLRYGGGGVFMIRIIMADALQQTGNEHDGEEA